jgi:hypothetical protein
MASKKEKKKKKKKKIIEIRTLRILQCAQLMANEVARDDHQVGTGHNGGSGLDCGLDERKRRVAAVHYKQKD